MKRCKSAKRHVILAIFAVVALVLTLSTVYAHSGRTDENGGHYNRSTGEYHYHHGFPAHQHTNGVCPYDFIDNTDHSNSGRTSPEQPPHVYSPSSESYSSESDSHQSISAQDVFLACVTYLFVGSPISTILTMILIVACDKILKTNISESSLADGCFLTYVLFVPFAIPIFFDVENTWIWRAIGISIIFITFLVANIDGRKKHLIKLSIEQAKRQEAERIAAEHEKSMRLIEEQRIERFEKEKEYYRQLYGGKSIEELAHVPEDSELEHGLPKEKGSKTWGETYTFYISRTGLVYHKRNCISSANKKINVAQITSEYRACKKCKPTLPNIKWVWDYKKISIIKEKYGID